MTGTRRIASLLLPLAALVLLSGCVVADDPGPSATPSSAPSAPASSPSPLETPDTAAADQIAVATITTAGEVPSSASTTGPALMVAGARITVRGECRGTALGYELRTAAAGEDQRPLVGATIDCGAGAVANTLDGADYTGPVQLVIVSADGVDEGWVQATQEPVG